MSAHSLTLSRHAGTFSIITHADARPSPSGGLPFTVNRLIIGVCYQASISSSLRMSVFCVMSAFSLLRCHAVNSSRRPSLQPVNDIAPQRNDFLTLTGCFCSPLPSNPEYITAQVMGGRGLWGSVSGLWYTCLARLPCRVLKQPCNPKQTQSYQHIRPYFHP